METLLIEVKNEGSMNIIKQLALLDLIKVISTPQAKSDGKKHKFAGAIGKETAINMMKSIEKGREEWERTIS